MKLTDHSRNLIRSSAAEWAVPREYFDALYNYLVLGFNPGGFWTSVLANNWHHAISRSHPGNTVEALKSATGWIYDRWPPESYGSYLQVDWWTGLPGKDRRRFLEGQRMIYTEVQEVELILKSVATQEPMLY